jgi:hypothetical protein
MNYKNYNELKAKYFNIEKKIEIISESIYNLIEKLIKNENNNYNLINFNNEINNLKELKNLIYNLTLKNLILNYNYNNNLEYLNENNIFNNFNFDIYFFYINEISINKINNIYELKILKLKKDFIKYFENLHLNLLLKKLNLN